MAGEFSTGFIRLDSARRMNKEAHGLCVNAEKELYIGYSSSEFLSERVSHRPGHFTLSVVPLTDQAGQGLFLSTNGHSALVDLWPCESGKQTWAAEEDKQSGHWHFTVVGGNTEDTSRVQLSCGLADRAGEAVDLWSEHAWILQPLNWDSSGRHDCPKGYYHFRSAARESLKHQHQWLALKKGVLMRMEQLTIGAQDSAVVLKVEKSIYGTSANHVSIKVLPSVCRLYLTALDTEPQVKLLQTTDDSGRQFWNATRTGSSHWNLSVTKGHSNVDGRHSLSCPWGDSMTHMLTYGLSMPGRLRSQG